MDLLDIIIRPGDTVFDIGANIGKMTMLYLARGAAKVVAVEPQEGPLLELYDRFVGNDLVSIIPFGLGAIEGRKEMAVCKAAPTISTLVPDMYWGPGSPFEGTTAAAVQTIYLMTLDTLIESYGVPRYCKIDVEGYEPEVLKGLSQPISYLSFEFHSEWPDETQKCLDECLRIEPKTRFKLVPGEEPRGYWSEEWMTADALMEKLRPMQAYKCFWGNVYARMA